MTKEKEKRCTESNSIDQRAVKIIINIEVMKKGRRKVERERERIERFR